MKKHHHIILAETALARAKLRLATAVRRIQKTCTHQHVGECPYEPGRYSSSTPSMRVCLRCGMSEEGWGPGFIVLKTEAPQMITRVELYKTRRGLAIWNDDKGPLIRKEKTVLDLIDDDTRVSMNS